MATVVGKEKKIASLYRKGYSVGGIAREVAVTTAAISQKLAQMGLRERINQRVVPPEQRKQIARLYAQKVPSKDILSRFGICAWTMRKIVRECGGTIQPNGGRFRKFTRRETARIARLWKSGWAQHKIGAEFGVHQAIVSRVLRDCGVKVSKRIARGSNHGSWKGGRTVTAGGYVQVCPSPDDGAYADMINRQGYIMEHRLVMARSIGRALNSKETVHHVNGNRADNRLENLQLRQGKHGKGTAFRCLDCGSCNVEATHLRAASQ